MPIPSTRRTSHVLTLGLWLLTSCSDAEPPAEQAPVEAQAPLPPETPPPAPALENLEQRLAESAIAPPLIGVGPAVAGKWNGEVRFQTESGQLYAVAEFRDGVQDGPVVYYYPNGAVHSKKTVRNGLTHGMSRVFFPSGSVLMEEEVVDGIPDGPATLYWPNGQKAVESRRVQGQNQGAAQVWLPSGELWGVEQYQDDKMVRWRLAIPQNHVPADLPARLQQVQALYPLKDQWRQPAGPSLATPRNDASPSPADAARAREEAEARMREYESSMPPVPGMY